MAKHGGHNKIELTKKDIAQIEVMAGLGLPVEQIAVIYGIHKRTFERMCKRDKELAAALEKGRAKTSLKVRETAYSLATSGEHPTMTMFWLKTREGFREVDRLELTGKDGKPIRTTDGLSSEQRLARIATLQKMMEQTEE